MYRCTCGRTRNNRFACKLKKKRNKNVVHFYYSCNRARWVCGPKEFCQVKNCKRRKKKKPNKSNQIKSYRAKISNNIPKKRNYNLITGSVLVIHLLCAMCIHFDKCFLTCFGSLAIVSLFPFSVTFYWCPAQHSNRFVAFITLSGVA